MAKISTAELERRLERARANREEEPAFFRCLLEAWVYTHALVSDDHARLQLLQFRHPDGFHAVPFFTSIKKARPPEGITAKVVPLLKAGGRRVGAAPMLAAARSWPLNSTRILRRPGWPGRRMLCERSCSTRSKWNGPSGRQMKPFLRAWRH